PGGGCSVVLLVVFLSSVMISQWGLILALLCSVSLSKRYSVYRITPQSNDSLQFLEGLTKDMGIDFWKEPRAVGQEVHIMIPDPKSVALLNDLRSRNISFSLMIDDVEKVIKNQKLARLKLKSERRQKDFRDGKVDFNLAEYHSFADVINYFNALAITYPHLVSVHPIGLTHEGRQIPLIKITNKRMGGRKRSMWIDGGIHAREWISPSTVLYFIHQLINGYDQDPIIRRYVDNIEWHLVPLLNPDGYEYSRSSTDPEIRLWRKNKSPSKCTTTAQGLFSPPQTTCCQGVDLNRNFDWFFGQVGSSTDPCSEIYNGAFAFSEPETRAVRDFISQHPITSFVTLHSYSQILMYPFGHQVRTYSNDLDDLRNTALSAANALQRLYGTTYKVGTGADTLYPASGGSEDWAKGKGGVKYSYLFELRPEEQVWDGFLLPENQIMPTARETWEAIKVIATHTLSVPFGASASSGGFHHSR
ncbi:hypothetical protein PMAYCL1PPCAC_24233, partial [Pristionchus mayeri]